MGFRVFGVRVCSFGFSSSAPDRFVVWGLKFLESGFRVLGLVVQLRIEQSPVELLFVLELEKYTPTHRTL